MTFNETKEMKDKSHLLADLVATIFKYAIISYLIFYLIETLMPNFVSRFYDLDYHLVVVLISGLFTILWHEKIFFAAERQDLKRSELIFMILIAIVSGAVMFFKTQTYGYLSYLISLTFIIIVFLLSYTLFGESK